MKQKVFVVLVQYPYEGYDLECVFGNFVDADNYAAEEAEMVADGSGEYTQGRGYSKYIVVQQEVY